MYFFNFEESFFSEVNSCIYFSGFTSFIFEMDFTKLKQSSEEFGIYPSCRNYGDNLRYAL